MARYIAHFSPEAWSNDQAIPVDPEGPQTWDCTKSVADFRDYFDRLFADPLRNGDIDSDGVVDNDDMLKSDAAAPDWVREWRGPFTIRVRRVEQQISVDHLLRNAHSLLGDGDGGEWTSNPEYTRAVVELIGDTLGVTYEERDTILDRIRQAGESA